MNQAEKSTLKVVLAELQRNEKATSHSEKRFSSIEIAQIHSNAIKLGEQKLSQERKQKKKWRTILPTAAAVLILVTTGFVFLSRSQADGVKISGFALTPGVRSVIPVRTFFHINNGIAVGVLSETQMQIEPENPLRIRLYSGRLLVRRYNSEIPFSIKTGHATYNPVGTTFLLDTGAQDMAFLVEGSIQVHANTTHGGSPNLQEVLTASGLRYAKIQADEKIHAFNHVPVDSAIAGDAEKALKLKKLDAEVFKEFIKDSSRPGKVKGLDNKRKAESKIAQKQSDKHPFSSGDCVYYFKNSERYQGEVSNVTNDFVYIRRSGVPEDNPFRRNEVIPCRE